MTRLEEATENAERVGDDAIEWVRSNKERIRSILKLHGKLLMRGFSSPNGAAQAVLSSFTSELMEDVFWSTPRKRVADKTFTATHYPAQREIRMHSEMAYAEKYPRLLCFHAVQAASRGGATPIADIDAVSSSIYDIVELFAENGVRYIRNFRPGIDIPFAQAFGKSTDHEAIAEAQARGMKVDVQSDGSIRTEASGRGALFDEEKKAFLWFNQIHLFHPASLPKEDRQNLIRVFGLGGFPRDCTFRNGKPIPDEIVGEVNFALEAEVEEVMWRDGDILLLDNLRYVHGRRPFSGHRIVHVAMGSSAEGDTRKAFV